MDNGNHYFLTKNESLDALLHCMYSIELVPSANFPVIGLLVVLGPGEVLALQGALQLGGWLRLLMLAGVAVWLYRLAVRE